jgi:hypothetical protein
MRGASARRDRPVRQRLGWRFGPNAGMLQVGSMPNGAADVESAKQPAPKRTVKARRDRFP